MPNICSWALDVSWVRFKELGWVTPLLIVYSQLRCLGVEVDCRLKWDSHVAELIKSFAQKLIFLGNCISHQLMPERIFFQDYFTLYHLWPHCVGSCGKTLELVELELMHIRAAKIIYALDWYIPDKRSWL